MVKQPDPGPFSKADSCPHVTQWVSLSPVIPVSWPAGETVPRGKEGDACVAPTVRTRRCTDIFTGIDRVDCTSMPITSGRAPAVLLWHARYLLAFFSPSASLAMIIFIMLVAPSRILYTLPSLRILAMGYSFEYPYALRTSRARLGTSSAALHA